jgi:hypothetical protein
MAVKRQLLACVLAATVACVGMSPRADGCAAVMREGQRVRIASESALIVWDEKTKTEHFIRRANFDTRAPYFGFLVPTPTKPDLFEVPDTTFQMIEGWTKPEVKTEVRYVYRSLFDGVSASAHKDRGKAAGPEMAGQNAPRALVEVIGTAKVAGLDATILKASDEKALRKWLEKHGYEARPSLEKWLKWYVDNGWVITAFQFKKENAEAGGLSSNAVRMSFKAERPFYPYREPEDARAEKAPGVQRLLRVFFVGTGRYDGNLEPIDGALLGDMMWPGRAVYSKPLTAEQTGPLTKGINSAKADAAAVKAALPEGAWLTEYEDPASPRPGVGEVYFSKAKAQDELARPPIIRYQDIELINRGELAGLGVLAGVILLVGGWVVWRFGLRAA